MEDLKNVLVLLSEIYFIDYNKKSNITINYDGFVDKICLTNHINGVNSTESIDKENISIITDSPSSLRASIILLKDLKARLLIDELQLLNQ